MDSRDAYLTHHAGFEHMTTIRARKPDDMGASVALLADVHAADGYPMRWPTDPPAWLTPDTLLSAWVAEDESGMMGHVALCHAAGETAAPVWSAAAGLPPERIAAVARLFVTPRARGRGLGAVLLATACGAARERGLRPALEVLGHDRRAIALYERAGWRRVGSAATPWASASGGYAVLHYYLAPE